MWSHLLPSFLNKFSDVKAQTTAIAEEFSRRNFSLATIRSNPGNVCRDATSRNYLTAPLLRFSLRVLFRSHIEPKEKRRKGEKEREKDEVKEETTRPKKNEGNKPATRYYTHLAIVKRLRASNETALLWNWYCPLKLALAEHAEQNREFTKRNSTPSLP